MSISIAHLTKIYGTQKVLDDASFEVSTGQVVGFLGPNGAGKSTTMRILSCFIPQTAGIVKVCGYDVVKQSIEVRRNTGYLPENNPLYYDMYVKEFLRFIAKLNDLGKVTEKRINEIISITGLDAESKKKINHLSKGYRQRVGLAQAILHNPPVLVLDEPTSGLDPNQIIEIRNLIKSLGKEKTVILSTHIMQEVQIVCDRVIIINKGRIVADDITRNLQILFSGEQKVMVEFKENVTADRLSEIPGVKRVERITETKYRLYTNTQEDIRAFVFEFAKNHGLTLLSMQNVEENLEEIFHELTKGNKIISNAT